VAETPDIALVSLGTTPGLRRVDAALVDMIRAEGLSCEVLPVEVGTFAARLRRQITVTDFVEALAARRAGRQVNARAAIFSTVTAALLQRKPRVPHAVRFDTPAAVNRPGASGAWQRARERRVLDRATLLLPQGEQAAKAAPSSTRSIPLRVPVEEIRPGPGRDIDVLAYAGYPHKRGLDLLCRAWIEGSHPGERLLIGGVDRERALDWLDRRGAPEPPGVEWIGMLPRAQWLHRVARARVFANASRHEDHGLSQLEALAAGCALVTVPSPGAYEALPLARELAPELVAADSTPGELARSLRAGLDLRSRDAYAQRALELLRPFRADAIRQVLAEQVLPALGVR
jgi:glycosyltransferase involved in cell wall biosynthesis